MTDKDPAAVSLGRRGGKAGTGAAKRRSAAFYKKQGRLRALKRWAKVREAKAEMDLALLAAAVSEPLK